MRPTTPIIRLLRLSVLGLLIAPSNRATGKPYHFIKEIPIGGEGGWDYLAVDDVAVASM